MSREHESDVERTPGHSPDDDQPVTRGEFRTLTSSVKRIEKALIGTNPIAPDPESVVMRVNEHHKVIATTRQVAHAGLVGALGLLGIKLWEWLTSGNTHTP